VTAMRSRLLAEQLDKRRFTARSSTTLQSIVRRSSIKIAPVNRNPLTFHPSVVGEFLAPHRNDGFLFGRVA